MQAEQRVVKSSQRLFVRHIAIPVEHGSWVFLFSPLLIGLFAGGELTGASFYFIGAALASFLIRQPITILVKIISKRRPRSEMPAALFWTGVYGLAVIAALAGLIATGYAWLITLAVIALPVFGWNLWLVSRRAERRQPLVEIAGSSVLALTAPAAYWVGVGSYNPTGWLLWGLTCLQAAVSIYYAYLRLEQRAWKSVPALRECWRAGRAVVAGATGAVVLVTGLSLLKITPAFLPLAYAIQWLETLYGTFNPAVGVKPTRIGIRQLIVSSAYTVAFILLWG